MAEGNKIIIFDTTLRDGEQAPGCSMNLNEKLAVARQLEKLGVDVIEAGFPIASPGDFEAVSKIAEIITESTVCGLARCRPKDIEIAAKAVEKAAKPRIHVFLATSPVHMKHKLKMTEDEVVSTASEMVAYAKSFVDDVEFSCEDASRSEIPFVQRVVAAAIESGARTINLPDTVGYALPWEYEAFIRDVIAGVPNRDKAIFSVHCHNDLGVGVANSLMAIRQGARQIEVSVNGIGERAGNAALEEVVMAIHTRQDELNFHTGIVTEEIFRTCQLVSQTTGMPIPANKAIVGRNAFLHESGIHQDGVLKERSTYEIMDPATIGITGENLVLGKHSGRHAFQNRLEQLGYSLSKEELEKAFEEFKILSDKKKEILDADLHALAGKGASFPDAIYTFEHLHVFSGTNLTATATLGMEKEGEKEEVAALAKGPIDAVFAAVDTMVRADYGDDNHIKLLEYRIDAITEGRDAQGQVRVRIKWNDRPYNGSGVSTSIIEASAKAYINAINKALADQA